MRASGSYESIIKGVSQQVPQDRAPGQHTSQVNMLSDPVNGLTRRHGSMLIGEKKQTSLTWAKVAAYQADTDNWRTVEASYNFKDYVVIYRTKARPVGSDLPVMFVYCRTTNEFLPITRNVTDAYLDQLESGGISALTFVGRYLFMAGNTILTTGTETDLWGNADNMSKAVIWIRSGAAGRTFRATLTRTDNTTVNYSVATPPMTYPGTLSTADIAATDPEYTKKVNDRVNAYNSAATSWIGQSTYESQPANMAAVAAIQLSALGVSATSVGSHIVLNGIKSITLNDGGDGSLLRGVADEVESVDKLSPMHFVGKVVKVRTRNSDEAFYMKAIPKNSVITSGVTEVTWVECAGVEYQITQALCFGTIDTAVTTAYLASSPALLNAIFPGDHPQYARSVAGDHESNPLPYVTNRYITYLGTFQDRLLVGSGGVIVCSKVGDYLNFFRSTMLTIPADDAFEMKSQGPDDDVLRYSVLYDQNLIIFGDKRQYVVSGKTALSPTNANMAVMSNYADTVDAAPHTAGGLIFYAKKGETFSSVHEVRPGQGLQNSPESYPASSQIDSYLPGKVIELTSNASPSYLFVRCSGNRNAVFTFFYVDTPQGRKLDSWSRWDFDPALGLVIGFTPVPDGVNVYFLREGHDGVYIVCDRCVLTTGLSGRPYLDSLRTIGTVNAGTGSVRLTTPGPWFAAYNDSSSKRFIGSALSGVAALQTANPSGTGLYVGANQQCYFEPTNPFMRDGKDKVILSGILTVTNMTVAMSKSSGFVADVIVNGEVVDSLSFNGRVVGDTNNLVGVEHVGTDKKVIPIGRETNQYTMRLSARTWLPFTVTGLEWSGQFFNRTQRF